MTDYGSIQTVMKEYDTPPVSDDAFGGVSEAVYVGVGGDLEVQMEYNTTMTLFKNVPSGTMLWMAITAMGAGTTATHVRVLK